jgi:hypothetical protein
MKACAVVVGPDMKRNRFVTYNSHSSMVFPVKYYWTHARHLATEICFNRWKYNVGGSDHKKMFPVGEGSEYYEFMTLSRL